MMVRVMTEAEAFILSFKKNSGTISEYDVKMGVAEYIANSNGYTFFFKM